MKLEEALKQQVYIECNNDLEKGTVVNILTLNGVKYEPLLEGSGNYISLFSSDNSWAYSEVSDSSFPTVKAMDFIYSNTEPTTNDNDYAPHKTNVL